jgi:hypothetical protein
MQRRTVAVVTGDVNASKSMLEDDARLLEHVLKNCFQDLVSALTDVKADGFTNFRGDAWQFVVGEPVMAVRATLFFRSSLLVHSNLEFDKKIHTSASIGFGSIKYLPSETSSAGGGKAYENSGKRIDKLRRRVPGMGVSGLGETDLFLDSLLGVVDALARHWTALQAQAVSLALQGLAQGEIAKMWTPPISQQAVHKHLFAAGWPAIEPALRWVETTLKGCIQENNHEGLFIGENHAS